MTKKIGFIGLGKMGARMAGRLLKAGFPVMAHDICSEKMNRLQDAGATIYYSSRDLAVEADLIITMLPQPGDTEKIMLGSDGILSVMKPGSIYVDMSTSSLELTLRIYEEAKSRNLKMLDAPVSGGLSGAEDGTLTLMVGGEEEVFRENMDILEAIGTKILYTGKPGSGVTMKLLNNLVYSVNICALSEVLALGESLGLQTEQMLEAFRGSSAGSYCVDKKAPAYIVPGDFSSGFSTDNLLKDIGLAMALTGDNNYKPVFCGLAQRYFQTARERGLGGEDNSAVIKVFRALINS